MTVSAETNQKQYTTQGLANETFPTTFPFDKAADLQVFLDGAKQTLGTNYSVTGGNGFVGSVVFNGTPTANKPFLIVGRGPATQTSDYIENDSFPAEQHEKALDRLAMTGRSSIRRRLSDARTFDAEGDRVANAADPVNATDLVTKQFAEGLSTPSITIPTPANPGDDDEVLTAATGAYVLELPPFKKTDLPLAGDTDRVWTATGAGTASWQTPAAIGTLTPRNYITNGEFQIAQRKGTGGTHDSTTPHNNDDANYVLDRWKLLSEVATDAVDVSHEQTIVPQGSTGAIKLEVEAAGAPNNKFGIIQYLSNRSTRQLLKDGVSSKVSLSFKARSTTGAAIGNIRAVVLAWTGTADSLVNDAVTAWNAAGSDPTFDGSFTKENIPANLAVTVDAYASHSVLDVALDTASTNNIAIFIWVDDAVNAIGDVLYISDIQLEIGSIASNFQRRDRQTELALCQRTFAKSFDQATAVGTSTLTGALNTTSSATGANSTVIDLRYPVVMRATPTIVLYNPNDGTVGEMRNITEATDHLMDALTIGDGGARLRNTAGSVTDGRTHVVHYSADAEL